MKDVKSQLINLGQFTRILDNDNRLSLTNIGVIIVFIKLGLSNDVISPVDIGALIATLASYQTKRNIETPKK